MKKRLTAHFMICVTLFLAAASSRADRVTVTNTKDALAGSLRQAIQDASPNDVIVFDIPTSDPGYNVSTRIYTINLTSIGLTIDKTLVIYGMVNGVGTRVVVRRNVGSPFAIFSVTPGTFVIIDSLTISNGSALFGGGIHNEGLLFLGNCTFSENRASSGGGGGGLYNNSSVTLRNCTFTANEATVGGAILNAGTLKLNESTLSRNDGIDNSGGVYSSLGASTHVRNSIVAGNTGGNGEPDVFGIFISDGYNFIGVGAGSSGFGNSGSRDQVGTVANPADPKLGPLGDHGGDTATMAPLPGSLVIDQGKRETDADGVPVSDADQRGFPRPSDQASVVNAAGGDGSDIGAVELTAFQPGPDFTVNTTDDHDDAACGLEDCTLREALGAANADADANTISFAPQLNGRTIANARTPTGFVITQPVTINGPGSRQLTISGAGGKRCLQVKGGTVVINGLTFAHGSNSVDLLPGAGILNTNGATLTLNDCSFSENKVDSSSGIVDFGYGGGVGQFLAGQLNINRCTFADNTAGTGGGGLGNLGGTVIVTNSTFTRNSALNGGAIASSSSLDLRSSTVAGNEASTGAGNGGGVTQIAGTLTVTNSIIAGNTSAGAAANVSGTFVSQGSNVIGNAAGATGFNGMSGDQVGVIDPKVGALADNGGLTDTLPLVVGSAAINRANAATAPARDQRGYVRPNAPDVGAFEFSGTIPVTLGNISTRLQVETGDKALIGGFILTGTHAKKVMLRAIGPSLSAAGVTGVLANPTLELHDGVGALLASNDNWGSAANHQDIANTGIAPRNALESAILRNLNPGAYTAIVRGVNNGIGVALIEVYDLDRTTDSVLGNISTRGLVQSGDNVMIGGFIVVGPDSQKVIIRAIGPSLPLAGKLANPTLELHNASGVLVASNDDWRATQQAAIIATGIPPADDAESAILMTLIPDAYTAIVRGTNGTTGIALVEAYQVDN